MISGLSTIQSSYLIMIVTKTLYIILPNPKNWVGLTVVKMPENNKSYMHIWWNKNATLGRNEDKDSLNYIYYISFFCIILNECNMFVLLK